MIIPFNDLQRQEEHIREKITAAIERTLSAHTFAKGPEVAAFESAFSTTIGIRNCVACGNGTDALFAILKSLGIKRGDEVITPAFSWISSSETISLCGATPVFADVEPDFYTLDVNDLKTKISRRTKAVIVVHLYGQAANTAEIAALCERNNLLLIEDCAQAHLTGLDSRTVGTFGRAAAFSFYPTKNLGAYGDAGCVVTNDDQLATGIRRFVNHGALVKDDHLMEGINSRMDTLQASVLLQKLPALREFNMARQKNAAIYNARLSNCGAVVTPSVRTNSNHTFHLYVIQADDRDALQKYLITNGIQALIHYPLALPNLPAYSHLGHQTKDFPIASALQSRVLSLPIYPGLRPQEISYVCEKIKAFYGK